MRKLARETGYPEKFCRLLAARGIHGAKEAEVFLNTKLSDMYDPFLMKGMEPAVERILQALSRGEKICIYGDYDVDGITATSILFLFLRSVMGAKASEERLGYYLPDRMTEGYGMNPEAVRKIAMDGTKLIVTVDTGITAVRECALARELGVDVIVTDHHECQEQLPDAAAVIDAKQEGETYPFLNLAGCGVSFKLVQALAQRMACSIDIYPALELAAVGTVADIVQLTDENRIIVSEGFRRMKNPQNIGLKHLLRVSGYDFSRKLTSGYVGFSVAPRLNAGGRMGDAARGVRLFTTEDPDEAESIAQELSEENDRRKETQQEIEEEALRQIEASPAMKNSRVIIAAGENWHHGVIGIVSSRIKDRYYRPNIVFSLEDGMAVGSARSVEGFNLFQALSSCSDLFVKFGGHAMAAGMTLEKEKLPQLYRRLNDYAAKYMDDEVLTPSLEPEITMKISEADTDFVHLVEKMEPFGPGMPEPVIRIDGRLTEIRAVGKDAQTLRLKIADIDGGENGDDRGSYKGYGYRTPQITGVAFGSAALCDYYSVGMDVSAAGSLTLNSYMGRESAEILVDDLHAAGMPPYLRKMLQLFSLRHVGSSYRNLCDAREKLPKEECGRNYLFLKRNARGSDQTGHLSLESFALASGKNADRRLFSLLQSLCVFEELELAEFSCSGPYLEYRLDGGRQALLKDSPWYRQYFTEDVS